RRQTSTKRDWSSDVCSSDLLFRPALFQSARSALLSSRTALSDLRRNPSRCQDVLSSWPPPLPGCISPACGTHPPVSSGQNRRYRSEERRIGKEGICVYDRDT